MKNKGAKITTAARLKRCNRSLGLTLLLILASGIQLEATSGRCAWSVWVHIILGVALTALSLYHIYLHYRTDNWFARFARNRNTVTRILWWVFLLTTVSGLAATAICCLLLPSIRTSALSTAKSASWWRSWPSST